MTMNPGASLYTFTALPIPPPTPGPPQPPPWGQHQHTVLNPSFPPGRSLLRPAFPRPLLVTGDGGPVTTGTGGNKVIVQIRNQGAHAEPPHTQTFALPQTPYISSAPGILYGGVQRPPPGILRASAVETFLPASAVGGTQAAKGGWSPGLPPQAPPPAAQLTPNVPPGNAFSRPQGPTREGGPASTQSTDDSCNPKSVYQNFRRWQRFKTLARRHYRLNPDAEALSCFLIPVLRSLAHRKPTMTLEEGLQRAVQEWRHTSNFDRMIYYEMAAKFKEFEIEEERQIQMLEERNHSKYPPPLALPKLHPQVPPGTVEGQQPVSIPKKSGLKAEISSKRQRRHQWTLKTRTPKEIPPEAVKEYMDIMDGLVVPLHSASEKKDGKWEEKDHEEQQEDNSIYADLDLLSYIDQLCAEEDFVTKVEAVIHPRFLAELLSPGAHIDFLSLTEELQQEEGLMPTQLVEKRLITTEDVENVDAPPSDDVPHQVQRHSSPRFRSRDEVALQETSPVSAASRPADGSSEEDNEELPSLAFLLAPQHRLLPWGLVKNPLPGSDSHTSGVTGAQGTSLHISSLKKGHNQTPHPAPKFPKTALVEGPSSAASTTSLMADFEASGRQSLALRANQSSQPLKRRCDLLLGYRKKKPRCRE